MIQQFHLHGLAHQCLMPYLPDIFIGNYVHLSEYIFEDVVICRADFQFGKCIAVEIKMQNCVVAATLRKKINAFLIDLKILNGNDLVIVCHMWNIAHNLNLRQRHLRRLQFKHNSLAIIKTINNIRYIIKGKMARINRIAWFGVVQ